MTAADQLADPAGAGVHIDRLTGDDLSRCAELERQLFVGDDPWRVSAFAAELAAGHYYLAARTGGGRLVGYAGIALVGRPQKVDAEVHTIGVDPAFHGRGVGRALLTALLDHADRQRATTYLEVRTDNAVAIALYRGAGFEVVNTRRRYYQPSGADAYTMRRPPLGRTHGRNQGGNREGDAG